MITPRDILVVLTTEESGLFFGGGLDQRLADIAPKNQWVDPSTLNDIEGFLSKRNPEILVGSWSLPALSPSLFSKCDRLRYISYLGGSVRSKIPRVFIEKGGLVSNWGNVISDTVAECALLLTLGCLRQIPVFSHQMHVERSWPSGPHLETRSLIGRRVGIHGFGSVAKALIEYLKPFNVRLEVWSTPVPSAVFSSAGVQKANSLKELFANNDVVIEVEALTPESEGSVDREIIDAMRPGTVFVNVGRGALVDQVALERRVTKGDIRVGLDVYTQEPLPEDSPLRGCPNAFLLPHQAGPTPDRYYRCGQLTLKNIQLFADHKSVKFPVTLEGFDRST